VEELGHNGSDDDDGGFAFLLEAFGEALQMGLDRFPKVLTETGTDQVLDLCRSAERISQYRPEDADSGVALRLRMLIRALIAPWTRHPQAGLFGNYF
jgi:hypothetical protein